MTFKAGLNTREQLPEEPWNEGALMKKGGIITELHGLEERIHVLKEQTEKLYGKLEPVRSPSPRPSADDGPEKSNIRAGNSEMFEHILRMQRVVSDLISNVDQLREEVQL